jgi:nodulation protein E
MSKRRIVITGIGSICGLGNNVPELWKNVVECSNGIGPITASDLQGLRFRNASEIRDYDPSSYFTSREMMTMDRVSQYSMIAAREAVGDAGIEWNDVMKDDTCIITGCSIGGQDSQNVGFHDLYVKNKPSINPMTVPRIMPNAPASHISMEFGITGFAYTISSACSSSNHAIGNAFWAIRNGISDMAVTGGMETPLSYGFLKAWEALRVISPGTCRPFDKGRQGIILGEGAAILILEELESALKRKARIHAEIVGFGMSSDASHITKPARHGPEKAMKLALKDAAINPEDIDYINAHGTGTPVNDSMEIAAIKEVFGEHAYKLAVSSTKSLHGHILGATGAVEAVITALALEKQIYPPTGNFNDPDPECDLDIVPNESRNAKMEYAMSNSFAFGGLNAVIILKKWNGQ